MGEMLTLNEALDAFGAKPCFATAADLLEVATNPPVDGDEVTDDDVLNAIADVIGWMRTQTPI